MELVQFMQQRSIVPDVRTHCELITTAARDGRAVTGAAIYRDMRVAGHVPRSRPASALITALSRLGLVRPAVLILRDMHRCARGLHTVEPQLLQAVELTLDDRPQTLETALAADAEETQVEDAEELLELLEGLSPPETRLPADEAFKPQTGASRTPQLARVAAWELDSVPWPDVEKYPNDVGNPVVPVAAAAAGATATSAGAEFATASSEKAMASTAADSLSGGAAGAPVRQPSSGMAAEASTSGQPLAASLAEAAAQRIQLDPKTKRHRRAGPRPLGKGDVLPHARCLSELVLALSSAGHRKAAMLLYGRIRAHGLSSMMDLAHTFSGVFEGLIETNCRHGEVHVALAVLDDWKKARDAILEQPRRLRIMAYAPTEAPEPREEPRTVFEEGLSDESGDDDELPEVVVQGSPQLSPVTLAFLEASCHGYKGPRADEVAWRVWDVCALMREQQEAMRPDIQRPKKGSHHVGDVENDYDDLDPWL